MRKIFVLVLGLLVVNFMNAQIPTIKSFSPTIATKCNTVVIKGSNFNGTTNVSFGTIAAKGYMIINDSIINATVDSGRTGSISVKNASGTGSANGFIYHIIPVNNITLYDCMIVNYKGKTYTTSVTINDTLKTAQGCDSMYKVVNIKIGVLKPITYAYVANQNSKTVSVINTNNNIIIATIPVGSQPTGVTTSLDGTRVYVTNNFLGNSVSVINTANNMVIATVPVGNNPSGIVVNPNGTKVYVLSTVDKTVSSINTSNYVVQKIASNIVSNGIDVSPDGNKIYISDMNSNTVNIRDSLGGSPKYVNVGSHPQGIKVSPDGTRVYVANTYDNTVSVINTINNTVIATISVGASPYGVSINPSGSMAYITNSSDGTVSVINTVNNNVIETIWVGSNPQGISVNSDGSFIYVVNTNNNSISVIQASNNTISSTFAVGTRPVSLGNFMATVYRATSAIIDTLNLFGCKGSLTYRGNTYTTSVTFNDTIKSVNGCDSEYNLVNIFISNINPVNKAFTLSNCNSVQYKNKTYINSTIINDTVKTMYGCDSIYNVVTIKITHSIQYAYVANSIDSTLSAINLTNDSVEKTIKVGSGPFGIASSPSGTRVYVTNANDNTLCIINTVSNTVIATIAAGSKPYGIVVSPDGSKIYVANSNFFGRVSVISTSTNAIIKTISVGSYPIGLALSPDGTKLYVINKGDETLSMINTATNTIINTIYSIGYNPFSLAVSPDGSKIYITTNNSSISGIISVINVANGAISAQVPVGQYPVGVAISPDGSRIYAAISNNNSVNIINAVNKSIIATIPVGVSPQGLSINSDGTKVYVINRSTGNVSVINTVNNTVQTTVSVGNLPNSLGNFIVNGNSAAIAVTDSVTLSGCSSVTYKGITYTTSTLIKDTMKSVQGCDSIYKTINATVNPSISGRIIHSTKGDVNNVSINYNGTTSNFINGKYSYDCISGGTNVKIRPTKNNDIAKNNGVSAFDVILTQNHILGKTKFNSPYKIIAADVNNNKTVTNIDLIFMKRLILGLDTTFTGNRLWAFVDSAYVFPDTTNPFPYKDSISFTNLTSNKTNQTFIGVKLGDVNYDWNPAVARGVATKPVQLVYHVISTKEKSNQTDFSGKNLRNDDFIKIPVTANNFKELVAMQYTLHFNHDLYDLTDIIDNKLGIEFNATQANKTGNISFLWTDTKAEEKSLEDGTEIFTLVLKSKKGIGNLELGISSDITEIEALDKDYQLHHIILKKSQKQIPNSNEQPATRNEWFSVSPNPTSGYVVVNMLSNSNKKIVFELINAQGKTLYKQSFETVKGNNIFSLNLKKKTSLPTGLYFLKAIGLEGENVKRIMIK